MKSIIFIFFSLFLMNGSNNLVKCSCQKKILVNSEQKCGLCNETLGGCEEFASEDNKVSLKKLILQFLKKVNLNSGNKQICFEECTHCKHVCSKRQGIAKILANILKKARINKGEEEDSIREIILKLLDPSDCEKNPCQPHCDPKVQEILKTILKRAAGCYCKECPINCVMNVPHSDGDKYKYWFRTVKENMRREYTNSYKFRPKLCDTKPECCQEEKGTREVCSCGEKHKGKNKKKYNDYNLQKCKQCQRPEKLICPRYVIESCPKMHKDDLFTLCADCKECYLLSKGRNDNVVMFCENCNALNSPFVQFTRNGYPFKQVPERQNGIKIRTKFLQINDFRLNEAEPKEKVFNPFQPKTDGSRKLKSKRKCKEK